MFELLVDYYSDKVVEAEVVFGADCLERGLDEAVKKIYYPSSHDEV